jgi:hypothetical protein
VSDASERYPVQVDGVTYELEPQGVRASLSDSPSALWGFQVHVLRDGQLVAIKTCFIGRVRVHTKAPDVVDGPMEHLAPVLHDIALEKVRERLEAGELEDEIVFA